MLNSLNKKSESEIPMQSVKLTTTTKSLFIILMMFSFTFVNAQSCPGNKIRVYKCGGHVPGCHSKCVNPNSIPNTWSTFCPCEGRLTNKQTANELSTLTISPNPISGSSVIYFFLSQSENVSLNVFDVNGRLVTTLAEKIFEEGENEITWNAADVNAGIYFLRLVTENNSENLKLIVAK